MTNLLIFLFQQKKENWILETFTLFFLSQLYSQHSQPDFPHSHPDFPHSHLIPHIPTQIPRIPTPIPCISTISPSFRSPILHSSFYR